MSDSWEWFGMTAEQIEKDEAPNNLKQTLLENKCRDANKMIRDRRLAKLNESNQKRTEADKRIQDRIKQYNLLNHINNT